MSETIHSPEFLSNFIILASKDCSEVARGGGVRGSFAAAQASKELHSVVQADSLCFCKRVFVQATNIQHQRCYKSLSSTCLGHCPMRSSVHQQAMSMPPQRLPAAPVASFPRHPMAFQALLEVVSMRMSIQVVVVEVS